MTGMVRRFKKSRTPKTRARGFCVQCVGSPYEVDTCGGHAMLGQGDKNGVCFFYPYRNGKGRPSVKLIRKMCLECMGGSYKLVAECPSSDCPLFEYRFGTNPNRAGVGFPSKKSSEQTGVEQGVLA